ncbi:hypothetical protein ABER98_19370 [Domibacillus aminovorans]
MEDNALNGGVASAALRFFIYKTTCDEKALDSIKSKAFLVADKNSYVN